MKSLTHGEFIEKMAAYKPIHDWHISHPDRTWAEVADEFDLPSAMVAAGTVRYWKRHQNDPQIEALSTITHYSALSAACSIGFTTMEDLRSTLISKFSASIGVTRAYPKDFSRRILRILLKASGLEWFEKGEDRRMYVHWKHDGEIAA